MPEGNKIDFDWLRSITRDDSSKNHINEIETDHALVFKENKVIKGTYTLPITLNGFIISFRKNCAYSSIEVYSEIFRHKKHTLLPEFGGINAKTVIDIGACEGFYSLKIKENNPLCKIVAVEPHPDVFMIMKTNLQQNGFDDVIMMNNAVYSMNDMVKIEYVNEIPAITGIKVDKPWLNPQRIAATEVSAITLPKLLLDNQLGHVDILKIDAEGSELEILKGGGNSLTIVDRIVVEYHSEQLKNAVVSLLINKAFELIHDDVGIFGDLYFARNGITRS